MKHLSFSKRLLILFILCSTLPLLLLSFVFSEINRYVASQNAVRHAAEVSEKALIRVEKTVNMAKELAITLSENILVKEWCSGKESAALVSDIFQLIAKNSHDDFFQVYLVSHRQKERAVSRQNVPIEYKDCVYSDWGILHRAAENRNITFFAQPHPKSSPDAVIALCVPVAEDGYVLVDILRKGMEKQLTTIDGITAFKEFFIQDESGCIAFSSQSPYNESLFVQDIEEGTEDKFSYQVTDTPFITQAWLSKSEDRHYSRSLRRMTIITVIIAGLLSVITAALVSQSVAQPVQSLSTAMQRAEAGELSVKCEEPSGTFLDFDMLCLIRRFNSMVSRIAKLTDERVEKERLLRVAEIKNLQAQISPHFLYNTLNSIKSMAKFAKSPQIVQMVTNLGKLLREGITSGDGFQSDFYSIEKALELVRNYFEIESMRWEGKFEFIEDIDAELLPYPIPRFVLQPVVENALVHGLEEKSGKGKLCIKGFFETNEKGSRDIVLTVEDDGYGMTEEAVQTLRNKINCHNKNAEEDMSDRKIGSNGIALVNTSARLHLLYGEGYGLTVKSEKGRGTKVTIRIREEVQDDKSSGSRR